MLRRMKSSLILLYVLHFYLGNAQSTLAVSKATSTIIAPDDVNLLADAAKLRSAMTGWGTDEDDLIDVLTHRTYNTRLLIGQVFQEKYGLTLWRDVKSETSGHFRTALKGLVMTEAQFLAEELRNAMSGWGTNEDTVINVLMLTVDDYDTVQGIKSYYERLYDETLEERIEDETSGWLENFLVSVLNRPNFNESEAVNSTQVARDLADMKVYLSAEDARVSDIIDLVTSRSLSHLAALQEAYYQDAETDKELYEALDDVTDHHIQDALVSLMFVSSDYNYYVAYELQQSMEGYGTDEGTLTRIIVTRADKDLKLIKASYKTLTDKELKEKVKDDTSGDYRKTLLNLIN